jgi:predicted AAA+ superfamily ATPase
MTNLFERELQKSLKKQSFFLFGPRQSGKTTLINRWLKTKKRTFAINLLKSDDLIKYQSSPAQLRKEIEFEFSKSTEPLFVFIDEIQKCPSLLDEIHFLIEEYKDIIYFILTGSSARKLKRASANMLGGRAVQKTMHPLTFSELAEQFNLDKVISGGSIPSYYNMEPEERSEGLHAYVNTYLKEEIINEALTRNVPAFSRFLMLAGDSSGEIINYSTIARETGVSSKTIKEYFQILEDTLIGFPLIPYLKSVRKQLIQHPKFYLFDLGVINQLCGRNVNNIPRGGATWGKLFEHFIVLELKRFIDYHHRNWQLYHWRTKQGHEVDVVLKTEEKLFALEIKGGRNIDKRDMKGLKTFQSEHPDSTPICIAIADKAFILDSIPVIPWKMLFSKEYIGEQ